MTKTKKAEWLAAIGKLEWFYLAVVEGKKPEHFLCVLCGIEVIDPCSKCLWQRFQGEHCGNYSSRKFNNSPTSLKFIHSLPWAEDSLKRLARWRKRLEKEEV